MARGIDQQLQRVQTFTVHEGMDDRNAPWVLDEQHAVFIENLEIDRPGKRRRRRGVASIAAASGVTTSRSPFGVWPFKSISLEQQVLQGVFAGKLYIALGNGQLLERACGVSLTNSLHMASRGSWLGGKDTVFITSAQVNDSNASLASQLMAFTSANDFSQTASMSPYCTTYWQGRLWCGANTLTENDQTLWWSELNDGLAFSLTNTVQVEPGRGGRITALLPVRSLDPSLIVFKERLIARFNVRWGSSSAFIPGAADALDTINSSIQIISNDVGCVATKSVQSVPGHQLGDTIFLAHDGFRALQRTSDGDQVSSASLPISAIIQQTINRINFTHAQKAASVVHDQKYHCAVPLDGAVENTHVLTYDLITRAWYLQTWQAKDLAEARLTQEADRMWAQYGQFTTDTTPSQQQSGWHIYRLFTGDIDPDNKAVVYQEDSKAYTFGSLHARKKWSWFSVHGYNVNATSSLDVFVKVDNDDWQTLGSVQFEPADANTIVLAADPLPWTSVVNGVQMRKLSLEDLDPGHMIQFRYSQTDVSDYGQIEILQTAAAARIIDEEFDNSAT